MLNLPNIELTPFPEMNWPQHNSEDNINIATGNLNNEHLFAEVDIQSLNKDTTYPLLLVGEKKSQILDLASKHKVPLFKWQTKLIGEQDLHFFETEKGIVGALILDEIEPSSIPGFFSASPYSKARDSVLNWLEHINFCDFSLVVQEGLSEEFLTGLGVGFSLASYNYKKKHSFKIFTTSPKLLSQGLTKGNCINAARFLVDTPPNLLGPTQFKEWIQKTFAKDKNFKIEIKTSKHLHKEGYGLICGVGQGRDDGPYIVCLEYKGAKAKNKYAGVGKGITFDTGGLDLKPPNSMRWMKKDMGGAAALFGLALWCKETKPNIEMDFVFCLAENSVSGESFRPGDVLIAKNKLAVEIHNTDAEGRLALASGLNYLSEKILKKKQKYDVCFDVATLTGAIKVGLDDRIAGLFSNDVKLGVSLQKASEKSGDPLWLMPLPNWTAAQLSSRVANMVNCKDGFGGAISAAEFLKIFVPKNTKWFHLDIYAWTDSSRGAFIGKGATGQGVQALIEWLESN